MRYLFFISVIRVNAHVTPSNSETRCRRTAALFNKSEHRTPDPPRVLAVIPTTTPTRSQCRAPGQGSCVL